MVLCGSSEPDPCCVWIRAEEASLCPAAPGRCSGLFLSAVHILSESGALLWGFFQMEGVIMLLQSCGEACSVVLLASPVRELHQVGNY